MLGFIRLILGLIKKENPEDSKYVSPPKAAINLRKTWALARPLWAAVIPGGNSVANYGHKAPLTWLDRGIMSISPDAFRKPRSMAGMKKSERAQQALQYCMRGRTFNPISPDYEQGARLYNTYLDGHRPLMPRESGVRVIGIIAPLTIFPNLLVRPITADDIKEAYRVMDFSKFLDKKAREISSTAVTEWWICQLIIGAYGLSPEFKNRMPAATADFFSLSAYPKHMKLRYAAHDEHTVKDCLDLTARRWVAIMKKYASGV